MRIGFEAKRAFHNFRGLGNYSRTLIEGLLRYAPENQYFLYTPAFKKQQSIEWSRELAKKSEEVYIRRPDTTLTHLFPGLWRSFLQSSSIEKDKLNIYHGLSHELPLHVLESGAAPVVTIHDLIYLRYPSLFPYIDRKVYDYKFKYACSKSIRIYSICKQTKNDLMQFFNVPENKIEVMYQSCHPSFYEQRSDETNQSIINTHNINSPYILYVGALEERKNVVGLVKSYSSSKAKEDFNLVLVGRGQKKYIDKVYEVIRSHNLENRVIHLSSITHDELPSFYQSASLFVFPSLFEGFGLPIVESLFSRTPVITSAGSCFPESGGPNSIYIPCGEWGELTLAIDNVLSDKSLQEEMITTGHQFVQKFHQRNTTKELIKSYQGLA